MSEQLKRKPTKAERHAAIRAARDMLRPKDGQPLDWAALKEEDCRWEKRRDDFLMSIGGDGPLRTDLIAEITNRLKK